MNSYLKLNLDDYVDILSIKQQPYWKQVVYEVPDNWWFSDIYYNVPLDDYMGVIKSAIKNGYTMSIGGDVAKLVMTVGQNPLSFQPLIFHQNILMKMQDSFVSAMKPPQMITVFTWWDIKKKMVLPGS